MIDVLKKFEHLMIRFLMIMMGLVLFLATIDLAWVIFTSMREPLYVIVSVDDLLGLFGQFMLVIIGIELLETIMKTYLTQDEPHYEVVLSVAIIAIARKVIILDINQVDSTTLVGIASIIIALTAGFFFMKRATVLRSAGRRHGTK
jgi:uncharacterized membrane protein (DUF373 family)